MTRSTRVFSQFFDISVTRSVDNFQLILELKCCFQTMLMVLESSDVVHGEGFAYCDKLVQENSLQQTKTLLIYNVSELG